MAVYSTRAEAVLSQIAVGEKTSELSGTKAALAEVDLSGRIVAGDALQTQREVCAAILAKGGAISSR